MSYITTLLKAKAYMKKTDTVDDALLTTLVIASSKMIQTFLDRDIVQATYTDEMYAGTGGRNLYPKHYPIVSVASIKLFDPIANANVYTYVVNDEYVIDSDAEKIQMWGGWAGGISKYKITYVAGYLVAGEVSAIPADIELACNMLVSHLFNGIGKENISQWSAGSYSETATNWSYVKSAIPPAIQMILEPHRAVMI